MGEIPTALGLVFPQMAYIKINPWLDRSYVFYGDKDGIYMLWFLKALFNELTDVATFFVIAKVAYQFSYRLFLIAWIFFGYQVFDAVMLWVNYKTSYWMYWVLNAVIIAGVVIIFLPEKKRAIVKSIK